MSTLEGAVTLPRRRRTALPALLVLILALSALTNATGIADEQNIPA